MLATFALLVLASPGGAQERALEDAVRVMSQVGVSPSKQLLTEAEALKTNSFRLHNFGEKPTRVRVEVVPFTLDEHSDIVLLPSTDESIDQWVVLNPTEFVVAPGRAQTVRFSVRPAVPLERGEHRFLMVFDESFDGAPDAGTIRARFQLRSAVYVQVGEARRAAEIAAFDGTADRATVTVTATGTAHARFDAELVVWPRVAWPGAEMTERPRREAGRPVLPEGALRVVTIPGTPVLPGNTQEISLGFGEALEPGEYTADLNGTLGDEIVDRGFQFTVAASE